MGRPKGSRNRVVIAAEHEGEALEAERDGDEAIEAADEGEAGDAAEKPTRARKPRAPKGGVASNVTDETIREALSVCRTAKEAVTSANGSYRAELKKYKALGIDPAYITRFLALQKRDPQDVDRETAMLNRMAKLAGLPLGTQLGMFDGETSVATAIESEALARARADQPEPGPGGIVTLDQMNAAFDAGVFASRDGKFAHENPHEEGSPLFLRWKAGWDDETARRLLAMGRREGAKAAEPTAV